MSSADLTFVWFFGFLLVGLPLAWAVVEHGWPNLFTIHIHKHYHGKDEMI